MNAYSLNQASAKSGSNVRSKLLAAHRAAVSGKLRRPFERLGRQYARSAKKMFSKADLRAAAEISQRIHREYHASNLSFGGDARKWTANRARFKAKLRRELMRALPNYRARQALAKAYGRDHKALEQLELAALIDRRVHVNLGDVLPPDSGETYAFTPPFSLHDTDIHPDANASVEDLSLTDPSMGYLVNRIHFAHDYQSLIFTDIYGINWIARHTSSVSCGTTFTTPAEGRLRIRATLQNFYNNIVISLRNQFGFSEGYLRVHVRLLTTIVRPNQVTEFTTTLVQDGYDAPGGAETTYQFPSLDSTMPYTSEVTTDEVFPANMRVQILAGTQVIIVSEVDDMATSVNALLGWQLRELAINIV